MFDNDVTFRSQDWLFVAKKLAEQLVNARDILEKKDTSPEDTAFYRGRVALAKELLKLPEIGTMLAPKGN